MLDPDRPHRHRERVGYEHGVEWVEYENVIEVRWPDRVQTVLDQIDGLTFNEIAALRAALIEKWGRPEPPGPPPTEPDEPDDEPGSGGSGVREPRRPRPSVGGATAALDQTKVEG